VAKKGGDGIGYSGHKHQKSDKVIAIVDNNDYILAPFPVAPVNEADTILLPAGLKALKRIGKQTELHVRGAYLNLDGGFDSASNRKAIFNAGLIPNVKENPRKEDTCAIGQPSPRPLPSHVQSRMRRHPNTATRPSQQFLRVYPDAQSAPVPPSALPVGDLHVGSRIQPWAYGYSLDTHS
jgi:hypothetical protein